MNDNLKKEKRAISFSFIFLFSFLLLIISISSVSAEFGFNIQEPITEDTNAETICDGDTVLNGQGLCILRLAGSSGTGNPFDQSLNISDSPTFADLRISNIDTAGTIVYIGSDNDLETDTEFVWDTSNSRLGILQISPQFNLDVAGTGNFDTSVNISTLQLRTGLITDTSGIINFDDENLITTGGINSSRSNLPITTSSNVGVITKNGTSFIHTFSGGNTPDSNTFMGMDAGNFVLTGVSNIDRNSGFGVGALKSLTTGIDNSAVGYFAGDAITSGRNNAVVGAFSLSTVTTGFSNMGFGRSAGDSLTSGDDNIFMGRSSGIDMALSSSRNTIVGRSAGTHLSGTNTDNMDDNVFMGDDSAGNFINTPSDNVIIGQGAGFLLGGSSNVMIGKDAGALDNANSSRLYIDNTNTRDPLIFGEFDNNFLKFNANVTIFDDLILDAGVIFFKETTTPTALVNYGALYTKSNNELFFQDGAGNEHLLHGDAFSNIWFHNANTVDVTISTQNALTKIDSFTVVGKEDDLGNAVGSFANNEIVISSIGGGEYELSFHSSLTATGGADKEMIISLGIELFTPLDITDVTDNTITPIVITSTAHGLEDGDMVEILGVLGNTAADGSFIVDSKTANTFEIVDLDGSATTGNGDYNEGSPTGDVTIFYPGNMIIHREVRGSTLGAISATGVHDISNSDKLGVYVANLDGTTDLTVSTISFDAFRIGD